MSAPRTSCGSSPLPGSVSGSQGTITLKDIGADDAERERLAPQRKGVTVPAVLKVAHKVIGVEVRRAAFVVPSLAISLRRERTAS
jgi:hypothetical protein